MKSYSKPILPSRARQKSPHSNNIQGPVKIQLGLHMSTANGHQHVANSPDPLGKRTQPTKATLLFVDDEAPLLNSFKRVFRDRKHYRLLTAECGLAALKILEREEVTVIVSDYRMPGMTGIEFLRLARSYDPKVICIMLSGQADVAEVSTALSNGLLYMYLEKPHTNTELLNSVDIVVRQYHLLYHENTSNDSSLNDEVSQPPPLETSPLGSRLVHSGLLLTAQLELAEDYCNENNVSLSQALLSLGILDDATLLDISRRESGLAPVSLIDTQPDQSLIRIVGKDVCESGLLVPVSRSSQSLGLALADPLDMSRIDMIAANTRLLVRPILASAHDIRSLVERSELTSQPTSYSRHQSINTDSGGDTQSEAETVLAKDVPRLRQLLKHGASLRAIELVNGIVSEAIHLGASDIHLDPKVTHTAVRFRVDGMLREAIEVPAGLHLSVMSRLKVMAGMDISVKQVPQDGRLTVRRGKSTYDVRVATIPTLRGEKAVCRLLDKSSNVKEIEDLGMSPSLLELFRRLISVPQGVIIATGPTGSGKTTTLYSSLCSRLSSEQNFVTIEDPIEYFVEDASQILINRRASLTFAESLRATLRQDPDVILVGEIRDLETAQAAFQAAMTGHLVFTSLHTNSAVAAITRLVHLGIEPFLIASSVRGVVAQRLARRVCRDCHMPVPTDMRLVSRLGLSPEGFPETLLVGAGCKTCGQTGYSGRVGLYELFQMTEENRHLIASGYSETQLFEKTRSQGMARLLDDGRQKVISGETTLEELLRVLGPSAEPGFPCPDCGRHLESNYIACPHCGKRRSAICRDCGTRLDATWIACPMCGTSVS